MDEGYHFSLAVKPCTQNHHHHYCAFCGKTIEEAATFDEVCGHWTDHAFGWCGTCDKERYRDALGATPYMRAALTSIKDWPQHICEECTTSYGCLWCAAFGAGREISGVSAWCGCENVD